jgi:hypothetical protein
MNYYQKNDLRKEFHQIKHKQSRSYQQDDISKEFHQGKQCIKKQNAKRE